MDTATTADLTALEDRRLAKYQRITYRSFLIAGTGLLAPNVIALFPGFADREIPLPVLLLAVAGTTLLAWFYMRLAREGLIENRTSRRDLAASGAVALALTLMTVYHPLWGVNPVFWLSAVALLPVTIRFLSWLCLGTSVVSTVLVTAVAAATGRFDWRLTALIFALYLSGSAFIVWVNRYQRRMWDLHLEAHHAREALAKVAVTEERLRFSRDLHDLLGHSLSLIAVKSELAIRLAEADPERAREEMADVRRAARESLREVRAAVRGYRAVELDAELAGVRAVLEAAGIRCEIADVPDGLPPEVRAVLAWAIREGATNVIKHSEARRCSVALTLYGESVVLEMNNDGVRAAADDPGSGLAGLAERLAVVGGTLSADRHGRDEFLLRAVIPLPRPRAESEQARSTA